MCGPLRRLGRLMAVGIVLFACGVGAAVSGQDTPERPNFVIIFTDDQGYRDIGCFGSPLIRTPHLDQMAEEGTRYTSFYSANSVCSPSRAALLTGCYPTRVSIPGVLFPRHDYGLNPAEQTIADLLGEAGYATACIGKWHLGHKPEFLPTRQGFDSYFGIPYSNDMSLDPTAAFSESIMWREGMSLERAINEAPRKNWVPLMRDEAVIEYPVDQSTLTQRYTEEAIEFITANQDRPFFLYLPHTMPHIPLFASDAFAGVSERGLYGDTIEEIDASTGAILATLKELEIDERTLVIFTSDNGPWKLDGGRGGDSTPLRDYKFSTYEGGMRVPAIMRWPGVIPAGTTCDQIAATIDFLPTLARFAGLQLADDRVIDGLPINELILNPEGTESPRDSFFYYKGRNLQAMRRGEWKVRQTNEGVELFNLADDLSEANNLADAEETRVTEMLAELEAFDLSLRAAQRPAGQLNEPSDQQ